MHVTWALLSTDGGGQAWMGITEGRGELGPKLGPWSYREAQRLKGSHHGTVGVGGVEPVT